MRDRDHPPIPPTPDTLSEPRVMARSISQVGSCVRSTAVVPHPLMCGTCPVPNQRCPLLGDAGDTRQFHRNRYKDTANANVPCAHALRSLWMLHGSEAI